MPFHRIPLWKLFHETLDIRPLCSDPTLTLTLTLFLTLILTLTLTLTSLQVVDLLNDHVGALSQVKY